MKNINLETLYKQDREIYTKTNFLNLDNVYLNFYIRNLSYLSIFLYTVGMMLCIFFDNNIINNKLYSIIYGMSLLVLAYICYQIFFTKLKKAFLKKYNLQDITTNKYIFYDTFYYLRNNINFITNQRNFYEICDIEMHSKSFLENPFALIIISIIITIIGILLSKISVATLIQILLYLIALIFMYNIIYERKQHFGRNKDTSFKLFLLNIYYYYKNANKSSYANN